MAGHRLMNGHIWPSFPSSIISQVQLLIYDGLRKLTETVKILQKLYLSKFVVCSEFLVPRWMSYVCNVCPSYLFQMKKLEAIKSSCAMKRSH